MAVNDELYGFEKSSWAVSTYFPSIFLAMLKKGLCRINLLLGNDRQTNETILNKQVHAAITE
jgi:hypothetical protein